MRKFEIVKDEELINIGKTRDEIKLPVRATKNSIAYDIYLPVDIVILPNEALMIWTGVKAKFNTDEALLINVRSSMGKKGIMLANTQGWIESDYYGNESNDGDIGIMLYNFSKTSYEAKAGDRIAQAMFINYLTTDNDDTNEIRKGGFGSTN